LDEVNELFVTNAAEAVLVKILEADTALAKERMEHGSTCLHVAARYSSSVEVVERLLLVYGPASYMHDSTTETARVSGVKEQEALRETGYGRVGDLPLHWACRNLHPAAPDIVKAPSTPCTRFDKPGILVPPGCLTTTVVSCFSTTYPLWCRLMGSS